MSAYAIQYELGHGDGATVDAASLTEVVDWLRENQRTYDWTLDNVTVRGATGEVDVYDLVRRAETGEPLSPPGFLEVEAEVMAILGAVERERVCRETLERVDRLREILAGLAREAAPEAPGASGP